MDKIYTRKIEVLCMPTEESFPAAHITVWSIDSFNFIRKGIHKYWIELI